MNSKGNCDLHGNKIESSDTIAVPEWVEDLAFAADIEDHVNILNRMLLRRNKVVALYYGS